MAVTDPRKLVVILGDLEHELERWATKASDMVRIASHTQNTTREVVEMTRRVTRLTTEEFYEDEALHRSKKQVTHDLLLNAQDAIETAQAFVEAARERRNSTQVILGRWEKERDRALAWQARAEKRVADAKAELAKAQAALDSARRQLADAERALEKCRNTVIEKRDSQGRVHRSKPDCSRYVAAVQQAQAEVTSAQNWVRTAEVELNEALAELSRAEARVSACEKAVSFANQALAKATKSQQHGNNALSDSERTMDHARAAENSMDMAGEHLEQERLAVEEMNMFMQQSSDALMNAKNHLIHGTNYEESAQRYRILTRAELEYRIDVLYALNRPELLGGVVPVELSAPGVFIAPGGAGTGAPSGTSAVEKAAKLPTDEGIWEVVEAVVNVVDLPAVDIDEEQQKRLPLEQMRAILKRLPVMIPLQEEGIGLQETYWQQRDEEDSFAANMGYAAAFRAYYGNDRVELIQMDDGFLVTSGEERVWLAQEMSLDKLPVHLWVQPAHLQPLSLTDDSDQEWELRVYLGDDRFQLRIFNMSERAAIPEGITEGDGLCLDFEPEAPGEPGSAVIVRFAVEEQHIQTGFANDALQRAETISQQHGAGAIYHRVDRHETNSDDTVSWFRDSGYQVNYESQYILVYKEFNQGQL